MTAYDVQRSKLEKLMKDPTKPVFIPETRPEKDPNKAPDFVYNVRWFTFLKPIAVYKTFCFFGPTGFSFVQILKQEEGSSVSDI